MKDQTKRWLGLVVGILAVVALVAYVGVGEIMATFASARPGFILASAGCYAGFFLVRGLRWTLLLRSTGGDPSFVSASSVTAVGWLVSTFVPMKAGEVTRTVQMARRTRRPVATVAGTVAIERGLDVAGLAFAASAGLLGALLFAHEALPTLAVQIVAAAWILPLIGLAVLVVAARTLARREGDGIVVRISRSFLAATDRLRREPRAIPPLLALTVLSSALQVGIFVCLFLAFMPGATVALVVAGVPLFLLSFIVSVTPGNLGTYESAFVAVFALLGFPLDALIPMGVAVHTMTALIVTILGGLGWAVLRLGPGQAAPAVADQEAPA